MDLYEGKLVGKPACRHFRSHSDREVAFRVRKRAGAPFSSHLLFPKGRASRLLLITTRPITLARGQVAGQPQIARVRRALYPPWPGIMKS